MDNPLSGMDLGLQALKALKVEDIVEIIRLVISILEEHFRRKGEAESAQRSRSVDSAGQLTPARQALEAWLRRQMDVCVSLLDVVLRVGAMAGHAVCCRLDVHLPKLIRLLTPMVTRILADFVEACQANFPTWATYAKWAAVAGVTGVALVYGPGWVRGGMFVLSVAQWFQPNEPPQRQARGTTGRPGR